MDFAYDARTEELRERLLRFMDTHVHPAEAAFEEQLEALDDRWAWNTTAGGGTPPSSWRRAPTGT